jgi:hypothetical protein
MTESTTSEPSTNDSHLAHGGPPDMVPFESPSHWERAVLVIALAATLVLGLMVGLGAVHRSGSSDMPSANLSTASGSSTTR